MKTLEEVKDHYANEQGRDGWQEYFKWLELCHTPHDVMQKHYEEISKRYATEYAKEALRLASDSADTIEVDNGYGLIDVLDKQSIISENNLPKHE